MYICIYVFIGISLLLQRATRTPPGDSSPKRGQVASLCLCMSLNLLGEIHSNDLDIFVCGCVCLVYCAERQLER